MPMMGNCLQVCPLKRHEGDILNGDSTTQPKRPEWKILPLYGASKFVRVPRVRDGQSQRQVTGELVQKVDVW